jgi:PEGA domain-containing protein
MNSILRVLCCFLLVFQGSTLAAHKRAGPSQQGGTSAADKTIRVYITDSQSWEVRGGWGASEGSGGGYTAGGARPQTAEIIKTFGERCPDLTVTNNKDRANYAVTLDHEGGKGLATHHNKIAVFNREGDSIFSHSTVSLGNAVKDACEAIRKDVQKNPQSLTIPASKPTVPVAPSAASQAPSTVAEDALGTVSVSSNPDGADVYADDEFVGNAPANLKLKAGKHSIKVKASGYKDWSRDLTVHAGSEMRLIATLEKTN